MDAKQFITRQLATTGWAPIHPAVAKLIDPEAGNANVQRDLAIDQQHTEQLLRIFPRTAVCKARIEGFGDVVILYRSPLVLAERIAFLTGGQVEIIEDASLPRMAEPRRIVEVLKRPQTDERLERLKALAGKDLPAHECSLRTDILKARAELGTMEKPAPVEPVSSASPEDAEEMTALDRAEEIIVGMLKAGPCNAAEILAAAEGAGISERTMQDAAKRLGVVKSKAGFAGGWTWTMQMPNAA